MTNETEKTPSGGLETGKETGLLGKIFGVFFSPKETFESLNRKPGWLTPFIIMALLGILSSFLLKDIAIQERLRRIEDNPKFTSEQVEMMKDRIEKQQTSPLRYLNSILAPVAVLAYLMVVSGVLLFGGNIILGGEAPFKKVLAVVSYSGLVGVLASVIKLPIILTKETLNVQTSLALFLSNEAPRSSLHRFLASFDLFTLWQVALISIGLGVLYSFKTSKAATIVAGFWLVWVVIKVALGGLLGGIISM